jgi:cytochrome c oxidase assembly protein subunit 15
LLILALLVTQVVLGIMNVVLSLPMAVAVLHNAVALGLLLSLISLLHKIVNNPKA